MTELQLHRRWLTPVSTVGELRIDGVLACWTLEGFYPGDELASKTHGHIAIPCGRYPLIIGPSKRFQRDMPRICDVPGREGILIHPGNKAVDTLGCVLVGMDRGADEILRSVVAFDLLFPRLKSAQGPMFINITVEPEETQCKP